MPTKSEPTIRIRVSAQLETLTIVFARRFHARLRTTAIPTGGYRGVSSFIRDLLIAAMAAGVEPTLAFIREHNPEYRGLDSLVRQTKGMRDTDRRAQRRGLSKS